MFINLHIACNHGRWNLNKSFFVEQSEKDKPGPEKRPGYFPFDFISNEGTERLWISHDDYKVVDGSKVVFKPEVLEKINQASKKLSVKNERTPVNY